MSARPVHELDGLGVGYKPEHFSALADGAPGIDWIEIHAENYMGRGGLLPSRLRLLREKYALSIHGVGLSLGAEDGLDPAHLSRLADLVAEFEPACVSEHLAWSTHGGAFLNDLLPLPLTEAVLDRVCRHVDEIHRMLGRSILLENPSSYASFAESTMPEPEFLGIIARRTGCGLLLDVNNIYVSCFNNGGDANAYLDAFPIEHVGEVHLAGCAEDKSEAGTLLIDDHGSAVREPVWALFSRLIEKAGALPSMIEWDSHVPDWETLYAEVLKAREIIESVSLPRKAEIKP